MLLLSLDYLQTTLHPKYKMFKNWLHDIIDFACSFFSFDVILIVVLYGCVTAFSLLKVQLFVKASVIGEYGIDSILNAAFNNGVEPF